MRARALPGALVLGLPAAILAHAAGYGSGHAMGGSYHGFLVTLCIAGTAGALILAGMLAWLGAKRAMQGSILAARLRGYLPAWTTLAAATALWFSVAESIEPHHQSVSPLPLLAALALAAWLVHVVARGILTFLAAIALAVHSAAHAVREPLPSLRFHQTPRAHRLLRATRRYARPPPSAVIGA